MEAVERMIPGEEITLAGEKFVLPPLPLVKMKAVQRALDGGDAAQDDGYADSVGEAVYWSLLRNYKDVTMDFVKTNIDMTNFKEIMQAFMIVNGFKAKDTTTGEQQASQ